MAQMALEIPDNDQYLKFKPVDADQKYNEKAFREALENIREMIRRMRQITGELAKLFAPMDGKQLAKAKKDLKPYFTSDTIERLHLMGKGIMPPGLALREKSIKANVFMRLTPEDRAKLDNPERVFEILTPRGIELKPLGTLSGLELAQLVDARDPRHPKLVLKAEEQFAIFRLPTKKQREVENDALDAEEMESILPLHEKGLVLITGKQGSRIKIRLRELARILGR